MRIEELKGDIIIIIRLQIYPGDCGHGLELELKLYQVKIGLVEEFDKIPSV